MKRILFGIAISIWIFSGFATVSFAQNTESSEKTRTQRLITLCKLWGKVKYFHPYLAYRTDIDWDDALVKTIPKVKAAETSDEFAFALQSMLDILGDPATRIVQENINENPSVKTEKKKLGYQLTEDKILLITVGNYFELFTPESQKIVAELAGAVPDARAVIFDLRSAEPAGDYGKFLLSSSFSRIERLISASALVTAGERSRLYRGFESASVFSSGQYKSGFYIQSGNRILPARNAKDIPSVFLINENSGLLDSTIALQAAGKAIIVFDGKIDKIPAAKTELTDVENGISAYIRQVEPILEDGTSGDLRADFLFAASKDGEDTADKAALDFARNFKSSTVVRRRLPSVSVPFREKSYPDMKYPSPEYRLLAIFRIWNVFNYFFPYKNLMERDWEDVLREFIPRFENSKDALDYSLTTAEMVTHVHDSHAFINGSVLNEYFGVHFPPVRVRIIENTPVVTSLTDEAIAKKAGIEVGDVILTVDGEEAKTRLERYARYISASTPQSKTDKASLTFMNGGENSFVVLTIRDRTGRTKEIKLPRKFEDFRTLYHRERSGEITKMLPGNIGYADLDRLTAEMIDEMFEKFKNTQGIIFDMRGYPHDVFWRLPQRLTGRREIAAALLETPLTGQSRMPNATESFFQNIFPLPVAKSVYKGKTVMLIDERAMSQAEHTGLFFRAANGTKFIGSPTAGANGEVTMFSIPGGISIGFTGQSVKFPDGRQLQRIGLIPDIPVRPTIKGIRQERDEVLEEAVKYLQR